MKRHPIFPRKKRKFDKQEIWLNFPGEPNYKISSRGNVKSLHTGELKSIRFDRDGYRRVTLYPSGKTYRIGRIVATVFLSRREGQNQVNHIDGDRANDDTWNLEWCTAKENNLHRSRFLSPGTSKGDKNAMAKLTTEQALEIKFMPWKNLSNREIGEIYGVKDEAVRQIRNNVNWKHLTKEMFNDYRKHSLEEISK